MENIHTSNPFYIYKAKVTDVYDGDTITVDIDLGFYTKLQDQKIRLYGINAPEMKGSDKIKGTEVRDWVRKEILGKEVVLKSIKDKNEKYGRLLGIILYTNNDYLKENIETEEFYNLNHKLIEMGYGKNY
jgi:micrococcal nuclease